MITMKIFTPLEVQPEPVFGAEDFWLSWKDDVYTIDWFPEWMLDNAETTPLGAIWINDDNTETADTFTVKTGETETVFAITDYRVVCQVGVWGWEIEAKAV
jgi:hypothetical protein